MRETEDKKRGAEATVEGPASEHGSGEPESSSGEVPQDKLTWSVRPCTIDVPKCAVVSAIILGFGFVVLLVLRDSFLAMLSIVILAGSLHGYFFRTDYVLHPEGLEIRAAFGTQRREWKSFKSFSVDRGGVSLSPFTKRSWLEHYRGVRLLFGNNREEVVQYVTRILGEKARRGQRVTTVP